MSSAATHRHVERARKPAQAREEAAEREEEGGSVTHYMEEHEWPRLTVGAAAAAGAGLLAVSIVGLGPAVVAGAAGYLAYREMRAKREKATSGSRPSE